MARRNYNLDTNLLLSDGAAPYLAAGWATVGGSASAIDLGNQGWTINLPAIADQSTITPQPARIDLVAVIYISAATISGSNVYKLLMVGSSTPAMNSGNVILGELQFGEGSAMDGLNMADSHNPAGSGKYPAGDQYELLFTNEVQNTPLQYVSMYVGGTFGSITFQAFLAPLPRIGAP